MTIHSELYTLFDFAPAAVVDFLQWIAQTYHLPPNLHMLDVGCGPGRILLPCADLGWRVDGLEPNSDYVAQAQQTTAQHKAITVSQGGFAEIAGTEVYDLAAAINGPFAYLVTPGERRDGIARIYQALKPGGVILLDFANFLWILRHYRPPQTSVIDDGAAGKVRRVIYHDIDWQDSTFTHTDTFYRNDEHLSTQIHRMSIIPPREVLFWLEEVGYEGIQTYNSYGARASQRIDKNRIMISAQKPHQP